MARPGVDGERRTGACRRPQQLAVTCLERGQAAYEAVDDRYQGIAASLRMWAASLRGERDAAEREALTAIGVFRSVGECHARGDTQSVQPDARVEREADGAEAGAREARDVSEAFGCGAGCRRYGRGSATRLRR